MTRNDDQRKKLKEIRRAVRDGKVKFAPQEKLEQAEPFYVRHVLETIAKVVGNERIVNAWVSDQSSVGDFFVCRNRPMNPPCDDVCVCDFSKEETEISDILGFPVNGKNLVVDVARQYGGE